MIRFVVFHTGPDTVEKYKPYMEAGRAALQQTNTGAAYVVLTDKETAPYLEDSFDVAVVAPSGKPLMVQYLEAQIAYEQTADPGLTVLAATDCVANRDLRDSGVYNIGITYRLGGRSRINNVAYVHDHDRMAWFLRRAVKLMRPDWQDFFGDQQAWEDALGPFAGWTLLDSEAEQNSVRAAQPGGRLIHLLPCLTHNYFVKASGCLSAMGKKAYMLHYKGARKDNMVQSVNYFILGKGEAPLKRSQLRERERRLWASTQTS